MDLNFGQLITVHAKLTRAYPHEEGGLHAWRTCPISPRQGMVIGKRTLYNGRWEYPGPDYYNPEGDGAPYFVQEEKLTAYLVVFDMHRNPVYILEEHIQ